MAKLWLTDRSYSLAGYLIRIIYWLLALYLSTVYMQHYQDHSWFKAGLMLISLLFVVVFLGVARYLDHLFKVKKK